MMAARFDRPDHAGEIRRALDGMGARRVLEALGLAKGAQRQRGGLLVCCPAHAERTPSCSVQDTPRGIAWHCFGCDAAGDALALVAAARGLSTKGSGFVDVLREAADLAGLRHVLDELAEQERAKGQAETPRPVPAAKAPERLDVPTLERPDVQPAKRPPPVETGERAYPDRAEVAALWRACRPVLDDAEAADVLRSRGLSPEAVELHDLARALPHGCPLPRWARSREGSWLESGHRLLLPVFDEAGHMRSLRGWRIPEGQRPKRLGAAAKAGGLVLANALGRMMLETGARPEWWPTRAPFDVVVTEGEPDFVAMVGVYSDADELAPAVLGIAGSGAWSQAIADRIPSGTRVYLATDHDEAGERYARDVAGTLGGRCPLFRWPKPKETTA